MATSRCWPRSTRRSRSSQFPHEKICTIAGIGCSSRFPYFVNTHGVHFIHGRALPLATGVSLSRPDLHVFAFGGDGDGFSIGGNHLEHCARKNPNLTYVIMDNFVYGLTKKQTSPTSPVGFKSKTDPTGRDRPADQPDEEARRQRRDLRGALARHAGEAHDGNVRPRHQARGFLGGRDPVRVRRSSTRASSIRRTRARGATSSSSRRRNGTGRRRTRPATTSPTRRPPSSIAGEEYPGSFGVFYQADRPSKNTLEQKWIDEIQGESRRCERCRLAQVPLCANEVA